jgi:hypothetical protein
MSNLYRLDDYRKKPTSGTYHEFRPLKPPRVEDKLTHQERIQRIKSSLEKINKLMADLKKSRVDNGDT